MSSGAPVLTRKHRRRWLLVLGALVLAVPVLQPARLEAAPRLASADRELRLAIGKAVPKDLRGVYAARGNRPIWYDGAGRLSPAAHDLIDLMRNAELDGIDPDKLKLDRIADALGDAAIGDAKRRAKAELALSGGYVRYVQALRKAPRTPMIYETQALAPVVPTAASALEALTKAASQRDHIRTMAWMTPLYAPLRSALTAGQLNPRQAATAWLNLARLRALPPIASGRWVLIDAASARLWMFKGSRSVGTMKVVVGKRETQTPEMAGFLRYAIVNPYWNMPDDLVPSRITDKVLEYGPGYVAANRYQLLDGWNDDAALVDPRTVNWTAVAAGQQPIRVRQLPGAGNFMGAVKFMFPNPQGIYLHDTPERDLLSKAARQFSNGCVRLEDAQKFGRWLLGKPLPRAKDPEKRVELPVIVPLYITYLTALPEQGRIAFRPDVYGRDNAPGMAALARAQ
jgi:murein L,D-transpeptidase YcbB/YkuD